MKKRIGLVVGTRPEAIKLGPVYRALKERDGFDTLTILTDQHGSIRDSLLYLFGFEPRVEAGAESVRGDQLAFSGRLSANLRSVLGSEKLDAILVQGDTTSALVGAVVGAACGIPIGHVEAGLRSHEWRSPFPEELNRIGIARFATWHFAPTEGAAANLRAEKVGGKVEVTGNTVVDAALWTANRDDTRRLLDTLVPTASDREHVFVTAHRRESFGTPMARIAEAIATIADQHREFDIIVSLHPNPNASRPLKWRLSNIANVRLMDALPYRSTIGLIANARAILTDSGGLQEEAPSFGVPVVVLRDVTERPEGIAAGCSTLAGTEVAGIVEGFEWALARGRVDVANPFGDGEAAQRIVARLAEDLL